MRTTAKFCKVSEQQYTASGGNVNDYNDIQLPLRATAGSAGYDFFAPIQYIVGVGETITVATGIRILMPYNWALLIYPRSGLGFKYRLRLDNTVGVIDSDYSNADNEGHIFIRLTNEGDQSLTIERGSAFAQGILTTYMTVEDDNVLTKRVGGLGSTSKC